MGSRPSEVVQHAPGPDELDVRPAPQSDSHRQLGNGADMLDHPVRRSLGLQDVDALLLIRYR
jgi:hypothetical protein